MNTFPHWVEEVCKILPDKELFLPVSKMQLKKNNKIYINEKINK